MPARMPKPVIRAQVEARPSASMPGAWSAKASIAPARVNTPIQKVMLAIATTRAVSPAESPAALYTR